MNLCQQILPACKALPERRYIFLSRGGLAQRAPLQTQLACTVLSAACTSRQHCAGSGMPLPYNARQETFHFPFSIFHFPFPCNDNAPIIFCGPG